MLFTMLGAVTAGLEVAYLSFSGLTTIIGISMLIYFIWVGILSGLCGINQCQCQRVIRKFEEVSPLIIAPNPVFGLIVFGYYKTLGRCDHQSLSHRDESNIKILSYPQIIKYLDALSILSKIVILQGEPERIKYVGI